MKTYPRIILTLLCASLSISAQAGLSLTSYQATVKAQTPSFYFTFDGGSLANTVGSLTPTLGSAGNAGSQFIYDVFQDPSDSVFFSLTGDYLNDPGENSDHIISGGGVASTSSTAVGTISCLFRTTDPGPPSGATTGSSVQCIFSASSATSTSTSNALYLQIQNANATNNASALILGFGNSDTVILPATNVVGDTWYYFALTYNESVTNADGSPNTNKAAWYLGQLNGGDALLTGTTVDVTNAVAGDGSDFFIGTQNTGSSEFARPGDGRVDEFASWTNRQLSAAEINAQFTNLPNLALPPVSNYQTVISNQAPAHYFQLAGNTLDSMNPSVVLATNFMANYKITNAPLNTSVGFSYDYFLDRKGAAYFSLATDAIYTNGNLLNGGGTYNGSSGTGQGSISGMVHGFSCTNFYGGQKYVIDAGGNTATTNAFGIYLENATNANPWSLKVRFGDSAHAMVQGTNILSEWYYFAVTYDETATTNQLQWWAGQPGSALQSGTLTVAIGSLAGAGNAFYIGNQAGSTANGFRYQNSSHTGNGQVSQVATWNRLLSGTEVTNQFNALSVSAGPPPILSIAVSGANVIVSWPSSTDPGYLLTATPSLSAPVWSNAGSPATVGNKYVVTNTLASGPVFYRLSK